MTIGEFEKELQHGASDSKVHVEKEKYVSCKKA